MTSIKTFNLKRSLSNAKAEKPIDTSDFVIKSQKELKAYLKANDLSVYRKLGHIRQDIPRISQAEHDRLNKRINTIAGYYKKIESFEKKFDKLIIDTINLQKNQKIMMDLIKKLKNKTLHLPKREYKWKKKEE